ncbi:hypothetical protein HDK77DRAFT_317214 [Phyllosticta capitalensis]
MMLCMIDFLISLFSTLLSLTLFLIFWWKWGSFWSCVCVCVCVCVERNLGNGELGLDVGRRSGGDMVLIPSRSYCFPLPSCLFSSHHSTPFEDVPMPKKFASANYLVPPSSSPFGYLFFGFIFLSSISPSSSCCLQTIRIGVFGADGR